jgi:hypothetical protein
MAYNSLLSHKVQNPLTANDHHTMTAVITHTFINIILYKAQNPLATANDHNQPTLPIT